MWNTIGFNEQKGYFEKLIQQGALSHAYLFHGPDMVGKKTFTHDIFKIANKRQNFSINDPDLKFAAPQREEGDTKIYIETIREIQQFLSLSPVFGPYKFVIIDDADRLTLEASNSFLKLLEEPSSKAVLILVTSQPGMLLPTIISRCQSIQFELNLEAVSEIIKKTKLSLDDRELLEAMALGRVGWITKCLDQNELPLIKKSIASFSSLFKKGITERLVFAKKLYEQDEYADQINYWLSWTYSRRDKPQAAKVLKNLLDLHNIISQPQFNHRFALDNFLINL